MADIVIPQIFGEEVAVHQGGFSLSPNPFNRWQGMAGSGSEALLSEPIVTMLTTSARGVDLAAVAEGVKDHYEGQGVEVYTPQTEHKGRKYLNPIDEARFSAAGLMIVVGDLADFQRLREYDRNERVDSVFRTTRAFKAMVGFLIDDEAGYPPRQGSPKQIHGRFHKTVPYDHFIIDHDPELYPGYTAAGGVAAILDKYRERREAIIEAAKRREARSRPNAD